MKNFIICLSKIPSSLETATNLKIQLENFGANVELFEGTYGNNAVEIMNSEGRTVHPFGIKGEIDINSSWVGKISSPGIKGCFYSHFRLWQKCVELNEPIIIWEDDIILTREFIDVDWVDVLVVALGHPKKSPKYNHLLESPDGEPTPLRYRNNSMPGCCGYAIKPHAAKRLVKIYSNTFLPADNAINSTVVKIQIHSHIMGTAIVEGKESLTSSKAWKNKKLF
jgi:GR25 family glycosyltransferase involved in LPS biosynthesis